jgi:hypothetical protein
MTTNAVYEKRGTPLVFTNSGGDETLAASGLGTTTGRLSSFYDRGAGAAPAEYEIRAWCSWASNPAVTDTLQIGVFQSDGTHSEGGVAYHDTNDAALTAVVMNACSNYVGAVICHTADTNEKGCTYVTRITSRYFAIGVYNSSSTKALGNAAVIVTPIYPDIQAAT